jgi:hypothetical protein
MDPYSHICSSVAEFNYLFGVISYKYPNTQPVDVSKFDSTSSKFSKSQVKLRFGLINEEVKELEQAIKDRNPIEVVDALCDILYVVAGAKAYFNCELGKESIDKITENYSVNTENLSFTQANLDTITERFEQLGMMESESINVYSDVLSNLTELFVNEQKIKYNKTFLDHLVEMYLEYLDKIVVSVFEISKYLQIDIINLFDIVHKSNMTKICLTELEAIETVEWYKTNELRYKEPDYKNINYDGKDYYVIYDKETNKILKSIKYIPAKFL